MPWSLLPTILVVSASIHPNSKLLSFVHMERRPTRLSRLLWTSSCRILRNSKPTSSTWKLWASSSPYFLECSEMYLFLHRLSFRTILTTPFQRFLPTILPISFWICCSSVPECLFSLKLPPLNGRTCHIGRLCWSCLCFVECVKMTWTSWTLRCSSLISPFSAAIPRTFHRIPFFSIHSSFSDFFYPLPTFQTSDHHPPHAVSCFSTFCSAWTAPLKTRSSYRWAVWRCTFEGSER